MLYISFDAAMSWVRRYGKGVLMAKTDIEAAFRLLPVHPRSFHLLGCKLLGPITWIFACLWVVPSHAHSLRLLVPFWSGQYKMWQVSIQSFVTWMTFSV